MKIIKSKENTLMVKDVKPGQTFMFLEDRYRLLEEFLYMKGGGGAHGTVIRLSTGMVSFLDEINCISHVRLIGGHFIAVE